MLDKLIAQLGSELAMEELISSPSDRQYTLPFDPDLQVEASELEGSLLLKGVIAPCPKTDVDAFLLQVIESNLFGAGTRGASLGLKEEGNLLTLSLELDYNSTYKEFKERLEDFVSVMSYWRNEALKH